MQMLAMLPVDMLKAVARNKNLLKRYDDVTERFRSAVKAEDGWLSDRYGQVESPLVRFSAEYGLHTSLPVYDGGLVVLAGDYLIECSDPAVPVVAVGMIHSQVYVHQHIREDGCQDDVGERLDRRDAPITRALDEDG